MIVYNFYFCLPACLSVSKLERAWFSSLLAFILPRLHEALTKKNNHVSVLTRPEVASFWPVFMSSQDSILERNLLLRTFFFLSAFVLPFIFFLFLFFFVPCFHIKAETIATIFFIIPCFSFSRKSAQLIRNCTCDMQHNLSSSAQANGIAYLLYVWLIIQCRS